MRDSRLYWQQCHACYRSAYRARGAPCPHCGAASPRGVWAALRRVRPDTYAWLIGIALLMLAAPPTARWLSAAREARIAEHNQRVAAEAAAKAQAKARQQAACRQDAQCWGSRHIGFATVRCQRATERHAKYAVRWPQGWFAQAFPAWEWHDKTAGTLLFAGQAELQNGFGAWTPYRIACVYDPAADKALHVHLAEGSF